MTAYYDQQTEPYVGLPPHRAVCRYCCGDIDRLREDLAKKADDYERVWSALQAETATGVAVRAELRAEIERLRTRVKELEAGIRKFLDPTGPEAFGLERGVA